MEKVAHLVMAYGTPALAITVCALVQNVAILCGVGVE
jgi:hypothetical protein